MILIANCFLNDRFAESFDQALSIRTKKYGLKQFSVRIKAASDIDLSEVKNRGYTHLIISGSEASTLENNLWDAKLKEIIFVFINSQKPVLGICYGHQFLAGMLAGIEHLRKRSRPEAGWAKIEMENNPIFQGISSPVCMVSHYDEVSSLPDDFQIIAGTKDCRVGGFQYKNFPIWGLQFHPEYGINDANLIFNELAKEDRNYKENISSDLVNEDKLEQNDHIFQNFFSAKSRFIPTQPKPLHPHNRALW